MRRHLGGDAYLTLFTLIGAHSVVCIDGKKLKMTENVRHTLKK